jgi:5-hydroxyisourate hydrolase
MPGLSIHVVDVSRGRVAAGMAVALYARESGAGARLIARGETSARGLFEDPALTVTFATGGYRAVFEVGAYYRSEGVPLPAVPFLDTVTYDFGIADPAAHYHLPFKCTSWGYSCFRGGA